jgi:FeS assembly protein SufB
MATTAQDLDLGRYQLGWSDEEDFYVFKPKKGLSEDIVREMSWMKGEPQWMTDRRLKALRYFERRPMPTWGGDLSGINFDDIYYYVKPTDKQVDAWEQLPESVKKTYDKLGIPEAERKYLAGVTAQYECLRGSTPVWTDRGVRPIKELVAGDTVFSLDTEAGKVVTAPVVGVRCSGEKEIFEVRVGPSLIGASANHPFLVLRPRSRPGDRRPQRRCEWVAVEDLRPGDWVAVVAELPDFGKSSSLLVPSVQGAERLPRWTSEDLCWWVGAFLAGGRLGQLGDGTYVEMTLDPSDEGLAEQVRQVTARLFGTEPLVAPGGVRLTGKAAEPVGQWLELNGLGGPANARRAPDWVFGLPRSERLALLAGYLDATGTRANKDVVIGGADKGLLDDVCQLARLTGVAGGPQERDATAGTGPEAALGRMVGFRQVESITPAGTELTYDIEVAGHHNFVADGVVVHNSEVVYHRNRAELEKQGVLFCDMDTALREYPDIVKQYFGKVIPANDNKFAALNSAVWSGGSFIYVPPGVKVDMPLQAYFRINSENMGQFERTLIIADEGAQVHYIEGCSAPVYSTDSLHSAVVEIVCKRASRVTYTTIQNWSNNVYNLVTKRAVAEAEAHMEWIDGNIGSQLTMKYPSVYLMGPKASGEVLSVAYAGAGQHQDAGAKMVHAAPETTSTIVSKSISKDAGRTSYRGLVRFEEGAKRSKSFVRCDALLLDEKSRSDTYPYIEFGEHDAQVGHEATISKVGDDQLFYLMSRGLSEQQAMSMIVNGFIEPVTRTLPMEYAVEWSRLIELQMEGSVG